MKVRILKAVKLLIAYIMLNIGVLSWIEVSAISGNKLSTDQTVMAEIRTDSSRNIEISVLGNETVIDMSFMESENARTLFLAYTDPVILSAIEAIRNVQ